MMRITRTIEFNVLVPIAIVEGTIALTQRQWWIAALAVSVIATNLKITAKAPAQQGDKHE